MNKKLTSLVLALNLGLSGCGGGKSQIKHGRYDGKPASIRFVVEDNVVTREDIALGAYMFPEPSTETKEPLYFATRYLENNVLCNIRISGYIPSNGEYKGEKLNLAGESSLNHFLSEEENESLRGYILRAFEMFGKTHKATK